VFHVRQPLYCGRFWHLGRHSPRPVLQSLTAGGPADGSTDTGAGWPTERAERRSEP